MHGLINRGLQSFVTHQIGEAAWPKFAAESGIPNKFESLLTYDDAVTDRFLHAGAAHLGLYKKEFLEDFGTFLATSSQTKMIRRLLRFGGMDYLDFLESLGELAGRVDLVVPNFNFPTLSLSDPAEDTKRIAIGPGIQGLPYVLVGILRAMADDYGALVEIRHLETGPGEDVIQVRVISTEFAPQRAFDLAGVA